MKLSFLRSTEEEILDQEGHSTRGQQILTDLDRWNRISGWYRQHIKRIRKHWEFLKKPQPFRILDVGCGPGGLLEEMANWGTRYGIPLELTGLDHSGDWLLMAQTRLKPWPQIRLVQADATKTGFADKSFDLATTTLMMHHLSPPIRAALLAMAFAAVNFLQFSMAIEVEGFRFDLDLAQQAIGLLNHSHKD